MSKKINQIIFIFVALLFCFAESKAQYYFGRNKVQYNNFTWYILKTEHFDIYFYPEMRELAEIGAAWAEETYTFLEDKFNHNINRRIPLIFYSNHTHFQQTNTIPYILPEGVGGFFEFIKGRVVVPANGSIPDFKRVIRHELIHVFTHSYHYRILKNHRKTHFPALPLWYVEGLAEYWSAGWENNADMFIKDAVLNGYLFPLQQMFQIYGSFLMYKEGQAILNYIAEIYGEEKIIQLIENTWKEESFSNVMKLTIGLDYKEFDREWLYYLKKKHYPVMEDNDFPEMVAKRITKNGINTKPAFFKNDKKPYISFVSNRSGYSNIYKMQIPGEFQRKEKNVDVLIKGERTADFESFHILNSKIDVNEDGVLVFVSKSGKSDVLYLFDLETEKIINEFKFKDIITLFSPSWSPDKKRLAFTGIDFSGRADIYQVNIAT
ncbi:PD40 domain-containing protein, partial [candidate division KSB1 bacterium]|nr:PD40 domain-containing protein [candidate division KSB1 bacterium]